MPATYEPIATTTLGSNAASITFSSISSAYTDLRLVIVHRLATSDGFLDLTFNSDTSALYSATNLNGDGSTASSTRQTGQTKIRNPFYSYMDWWALSTVDIFSYTGSTNKTCLVTTSADDNLADAYISVIRSVALYRSTSAISSLTFTGINSNILSGTTATLYGILRA
jgi:hypothetical protein